MDKEFWNEFWEELEEISADDLPQVEPLKLDVETEETLPF